MIERLTSREFIIAIFIMVVGVSFVMVEAITEIVIDTDELWKFMYAGLGLMGWRFVDKIKNGGTNATINP